MPEKSGYRIRAAIFRRGALHPAGHHPEPKRRGRPGVKPPLYTPPSERVWLAASHKLARQVAGELKNEFGADVVAVHVEREEPAPPRPRPLQLSLADVAGDWPRMPRPAKVEEC